VAEVQRVARQQIAAGADWIKMYGSTGSDKDVTGFQTFTYEEMEAAVDVAHQSGKRIAIHSYGPDAPRDAIRAGADSIEHSTDMDELRLLVWLNVAPSMCRLSTTIGITLNIARSLVITRQSSTGSTTI
jgi:hypothetical protein